MNLTEEKKTPLRVQDIEKKRSMLSMHFKGSAPVSRLMCRLRVSRLGELEGSCLSRRPEVIECKRCLTRTGALQFVHLHRKSKQSACCKFCTWCRGIATHHVFINHHVDEAPD